MYRVGRVNLVAARGGILLATLVALGVPNATAQSGDVVLSAASASVRAGRWAAAADSNASTGTVLRHPNAGAAKLTAPLASPADYFELTFTAEAGKPYRLWLRGRAEGDHWSNDSVFVQFSNSVTSSGTATYRIGTTSAASVNLEDCDGCGLPAAYTWQDNGWGTGVLGPAIYFAASGTQRMRVQTREDGLSVDQIVLSSAAYLTSAPTTTLGTSTTSNTTTASDITLDPTTPALRGGAWSVASDSTAIAGRVIRHADAGASKLSTALANPTNYFELTFDAVAGKPYRVWLHGRADRDSWANDSVFVQFSGSTNASGSAIYRMGTTSAAEINLEDCSGCGLNGWAWQDNGWGTGILGPVVYFATSGPQRMRIQTREDGLAVDRIILSPTTYLTTAPAATTAVTATEITLDPTAASVRAGYWTVASDSSAISGRAITHPDHGAAKLAAPLAAPANYFELTFNAVAGKPYRLWVHGRAERDASSNDSVFVQFSASTTSSGSAVYRIGTTSAAEMNLEDCSGCGLSGWKWQDNGWGSGVLGPEIYFATTGAHRLRVQTREDGILIDRITLSPASYLTSAPPPMGGTPTEPAPAPAPAPEPNDPAPTGSSLRVLQWNIAQGWGQDSKSNIDRVVDWVIKMKPDVISFNEIMVYASSNQCQMIVDKLKARTGQTWRYHWVQKWGAASGEGSAIMSRFALESVDDHLLSYERAVAQARIIVNGRHISLFATHLDHLYSSRRVTQVQQVKTWASGFPEQRIVIGDFNGWPGTAEITEMARDYYDAWAEAVKVNTDIAYPDNPDGNTRRSRIDYVWYSRGATALVLKSAQVYDTRDSSGLKPSDHNPLVATFEVR